VRPKTLKRQLGELEYYLLPLFSLPINPAVKGIVSRDFGFLVLISLDRYEVEAKSFVFAFSPKFVFVFCENCFRKLMRIAKTFAKNKQSVIWQLNLYFWVRNVLLKKSNGQFRYKSIPPHPPHVSNMKTIFINFRQKYNLYEEEAFFINICS
jgi:hypothetical protein